MSVIPPFPRFLLVADVRSEQARHIGDEAMLEANLHALRTFFPAAAFTVVGRDPGWIAARYGVAAVPSLRFPGAPEADTVDAVSSSDAVIFSGGGNLSSTWPDLLHERVALLELAHRLGKPAVVLGQTIGPHLGDDDRQLLAASLLGVQFLGVRELASAILAVNLGIPHRRIWYQFDDAMRVDEPAAVAPAGATIAVTIDPQLRANGKDLFASLAQQLRMLSDTTNARLVLVPHEFGGEASGHPSDLTEARLLAEAIGTTRTSIAEGLDVEGARRAAAGASLIISSRYHPIVFGLLAGVPSLGIYGDDYCRIKLQGALAHAGFEKWAVTYDEVAAGGLLEASLELWTLRETIQAGLNARAASWQAECRERWTAIRGVLTGESTPLVPSTLFGRPPDEVMPALASAASAQQTWSEAVLASREAGHRRAQMHLQAELGPRRTLVRYLAALQARLGWR